MRYRARFLCAPCRGDPGAANLHIGDRRICDQCGKLKYCSECFFEVQCPEKRVKKKK